MLLKTNPSIRVSWEDGKTALNLPNHQTEVLSAEDALFFFVAFRGPTDSETVIASAENPETARAAIEKLFHWGALIEANAKGALPYDLRFEKRFVEIQSAVASFTMGTPAINYALYKAVEHIVAVGIPGSIVESGVWKGGSAMICALALKALGETSRPIVMFDTFKWMWPGTHEKDGFSDGRLQSVNRKRDESFGPGKSMSQDELSSRGVSLESVRKNLLSTGYPEENLVFVEGDVMETIPRSAPQEIALLRLDTDLYKSTAHELTHLYPRLVSGGILLVDDYPTQKGATAAVDEYFSEPGRHIFLSRLDIQGRIGVKP